MLPRKPQQQNMDEFVVHKSSIRKSTEICRVCQTEFPNLRMVIDHTREEHSSNQLPLPINLMCTICGKRIGLVEELAYHYHMAHEVAQCELQSMIFRDAVEFYTWKSELETQTCSIFVKRRRTYTDHDVVLFFSCGYSWGDNRNALKAKKAERLCSAFIKAKQQLGESLVVASFCLHHMGHNTPELQQFWGSVKKSLHCRISFHNSKESTGQKAPENPDTIAVSALDHFRTPGPSAASEPADGVVDLEEKAGVYWDMMRQKLEESDFYSLSISECWETSDSRQCRVCRVEFKNRKTMLRHMLRVHGKDRSMQSKFGRPVRCLFCNMEMAPPAMKHLIDHYINAHRQPIRLEKATFDGMTAFNMWRETIAGTTFRRNKYYQAANGNVRQYWACKHSGKLTNQVAGVTEGHCPAWIFAEETVSVNEGNGEVQVSYCIEHIGHTVPSERNRRMVQPIVRPRLSNTWSLSSIVTTSSVDGTNESAWTDNEPIVLLADTVGVTSAPGLLGDTDTGNTEQFMGAVSSADSSTLMGSALQSPISSSIPETALTVGTNRLNQDFGAASISFNLNESQELNSNLAGLVGAENVNGAFDNAITSTNDTAAAEQGAACSQIEVLVQSVSGQEKSVKLSLEGFPLVLKDGRVYYALEESSLVEAVSRRLSQQGECLYEGDQVTILRLSQH